MSIRVAWDRLHFRVNPPNGRMATHHPLFSHTPPTGYHPMDKGNLRSQERYVLKRSTLSPIVPNLWAISDDRPLGPCRLKNARELSTIGSQVIPDLYTHGPFLCTLGALQATHEALIFMSNGVKFFEQVEWRLYSPVCPASNFDHKCDASPSSATARKWAVFRFPRPRKIHL